MFYMKYIYISVNFVSLTSEKMCRWTEIVEEIYLPNANSEYWMPNWEANGAILKVFGMTGWRSRATAAHSLTEMKGFFSHLWVTSLIYSQRCWDHLIKWIQETQLERFFWVHSLQTKVWCAHYNWLLLPPQCLFWWINSCCFQYSFSTKEKQRRQTSFICRKTERHLENLNLKCNDDAQPLLLWPVRSCDLSEKTIQ